MKGMAHIHDRWSQGGTLPKPFTGIEPRRRNLHIVIINEKGQAKSIMSRVEPEQENRDRSLVMISQTKTALN